MELIWRTEYYHPCFLSILETIACFLSRGEGGKGGELLNSISFGRRRLWPAVQSLTFLCTILNRKCNPLIKPSWKNAALLRTMYMFMLAVMFFNLWALYPFIYVQPEGVTAMFCADPCPCTCLGLHRQYYIPLGYVFFWTYRLVNILIPDSWGFLFPGVIFNKCWFLSCYFLSATPLPPTGFSVLPENTGGVRVQWVPGFYSLYDKVVTVTYHAEHKPNKVCKTF